MRVLILEDEPVHSRHLTRLLRELMEEELQSVRCQKTVAAAEYFLQEDAVDIVFLDLNLYGQDGFDLLRNFAGAPFSTVVVSAHPERAIEAFEYGVTDFLPKPVTKERLEAALQRFSRNRHENRHLLKYFSFARDGIVETVSLADVLFFEASGKNLILHTANGTRSECRRKIGDVAKILPPFFRRAHRSYIVNIRYIKGLRAFLGGKYEIEVQGGAVLPLSRAVYRILKEEILPGV